MEHNRKDNRIRKHRTMQGAPRDKANIEAEKGETILTSDELSNEKKLRQIEGEKHSNGGEPIDATAGAAIFSDHLKLEDPNLLKIFGFTGKKAKTFAELSKKHDPTKEQEELKEDEHADEITKRSLKKTIDDKLFKQSFAFLLQQMHQEKEGEQIEHSRLFEPALKRFGIDYQELFNKENLSTEKTDDMPKEELTEQKAKKGTETKIDIVSFKPLPKAENGSPGYSADDKKAKLAEGNRMLKEILGPNAVQYNTLNEFLDNGLAIIQENFRVNPDLAVNYLSNYWEVSSASQSPAAKMVKMLKEKGVWDEGRPHPNDLIKLALDEGKITQEDVVNAAVDDLWHYRGVYTKHLTPEEWEERQKDIEIDYYAQLKEEEEGNITALEWVLNRRGVEQDGLTYYKTKTPGEYIAVRENPDGTFEEITINKEDLDEAKKNIKDDWKDVKDFDPGVQRPEDYRFDWANKRALRAAKQAKRRIIYERPTAQFTDTFFTDQAYYNPDQAIAAIQSMTGDLSKQQSMFANPMAQAANQSQLAANAFEQIGQTIGQYADKNVDAYNRERLTNTSIAQNAANQKSNQIQAYLAQNATAKQQYANALSLAEQNIAAQEIGMFDRRAKRKNIEKAVGEQYYIDPDTGFQVFTGIGKELDTTRSKDMMDKFNNYRQTYKNMKDSDIIKLIELEVEGKITRDDQYYNKNDYNG